VLRRLGLERALVVHGAGGLDELSTLGPTLVAELHTGEITSREVTPEHADLPRAASAAAFAGGDAARNAEITLGILSGRDAGPRTDLVLLNAAAGLYCCGRAGSLPAGVTEARRLVASGAAMEALDALREVSTARRPAGV
jgi:anthranilate phosphoribosyltransferase